MEKGLKIASLFSGCGGLDLGFKNAGFHLIFANDNDKDVWGTFEANHRLKIERKSITEIDSDEIPEIDGIIGGSPCQSWSLAGSMRGIADKRGQLFYSFFLFQSFLIFKMYLFSVFITNNTFP